jgi:hypothetical protein
MIPLFVSFVAIQFLSKMVQKWVRYDQNNVLVSSANTLLAMCCNPHTNPCTNTLCTVHMLYLFDSSMIHLAGYPLLTTDMALIVTNIFLRFQIYGLSMLKLQGDDFT